MASRRIAVLRSSVGQHAGAAAAGAARLNRALRAESDGVNQPRGDVTAPPVTTRTCHEHLRPLARVRAGRPRRLGGGRLHPLPPARRPGLPSASATSARRSAARRSYIEPLQHGSRHAGRALRRDLVRVRGAAVGRRARRAPPPSARACPGISSRCRRSRSRPCLYLGYASFVLLKLVCLLCLTTYAAVIGLFLVSGAATSFPMTTLPRRAARDLRVLVASPLAIAVAVLFFAGAASTLAFFPREAARRRRRVRPTRPPTRQPTAGTQRRSEFERWYAAAAARAARRAGEGAKVLIVKFNDFQCPPCGQSLPAVQADLRQVRSRRSPGAVRLVLKDYPLDSECNASDQQTTCTPRPATRRSRCGSRRGTSRAEAMEEWLYDQPADDDAARRPPGGARHRPGHRLRRAATPSTLERSRSDIALGRQLGVTATPDLLHQRREDRRRAAAAVLRSGDRLRARAQFEVPKLSPTLSRNLRSRTELAWTRCLPVPALATDELTKDYAVGFWRKRPYRALDRLTLEVEPGEVFGFLGPNGAGKTTTLKLLMQLVFPTSRHARASSARPLGDLAVKRRIGYLPENPYFYDYLTAEELLTYFAALFGYRGAERPAARQPAARRGRHRRRAPAAAAQVLQGHAAARRHRAGAHQRSRARHLRRADVGPRSARPPRRPRAHPAAARSRLHGVLQLARAERRRGALQPRGDSREGTPRRERAADRHARVPASTAGSWSSPTSATRCVARSDARAARRAHQRGPLHARAAARAAARALLAELVGGGAHLVSLNPIRETLEDFFVEQVTAPQVQRSRGLDDGAGRAP